MTEIRNLERDKTGERTFKYEKYLVGLARDALNESPLESYPSPLDDPAALPPEIRSLLVKYATNRVKAVALSHGMPTRVHKGDRDFGDTLAKWRKSREADAQWLRAHRTSPIVQTAMNEVRRNRAFIDLTTGRGYPKFGNYDDMETYSRNWRRWMERRENAVKWVGE